MAVTFTGTLLDRQVFGREFVTHAKITCTGTSTTADNGDNLPAATVGLASLSNVIVHGLAVDSESNPENAFALGVVQPTVGTFNIVFYTAHGTPGPTVPLIALTDGTDVTNYVFYVTAFGRC